jgi:cell fate (sporulation/competence/biofilm development) regulator YmcA (YheA/YmcA/DUF963 family)
MINFLKALFAPDPNKKIQNTIAQKYKEAVQFQRNGKLREYATVMQEIKELEDTLYEVTNEDR